MPRRRQARSRVSISADPHWEDEKDASERGVPGPNEKLDAKKSHATTALQQIRSEIQRTPSGKTPEIMLPEK